jgi:phenylacetate-CoA ligase
LAMLRNLLHHAVPVFVRQLYFPLVQRYKNEHLLEYLKTLKQYEQLSPQVLHQKQEALLRQIVIQAKQNTFWRTRLASLPNNFTAKDFEQVTPLTKTDLREYYALLTNQEENVLQEATTSGSTGVAVRIKLSPEHQAWNFASQWLGRSWYNIEIGDPGVWIWGRPIYSWKKRAVVTTKARLNNLLLLQIFDLSEETLASWWKQIQRFRPVYFYGYASALDRLAEYIESQTQRVSFPVKLVSTTAEVLYDFQRERLQRVFGAPVANEYGSTETGSIAFECPERGWHLMSAHTYTEFLQEDLSPSEPGKLGEVVVTPLHNSAMPLLRYRLGDMGASSDQTCRCGRPWPLMQMGAGKTVEAVKTKSGKIMSGALFHYINRGLLEQNLRGIASFRVTQKTLEHFFVEYVKEPGEIDKAKKFFTEQLQNTLRENVVVTFQEVPSIQPDPSGKLRYFISLA